jgi:hypothetical protein
MRFSTITPATFIWAIAVVLLPGCSGANVQPSATALVPTAAQNVTPNTSGAYIYTCAPAYTMSGKGNCSVYDTAGHLLAQLTPDDDLSYPWGTALFGGNWYIANSGFEQIRVYTQGTSPQYVETLSDPSAYPIDVAVYGDKGKVKLVAVANNASPDSGSGGAVVYKGDATLPSYSLAVPSGELYGLGIAFDSKGDCVFSYGGSGPGGYLLMYKKCAGNYTQLNTKIHYPGGVIFDEHDNLITIDQKRGIVTCAGTSNCNVAVPGHNFFDLSLNSAGTDLWVTRYSSGEILDYAYPGLTLKSKFRPKDSKTEPTAGIAAS